MTAQARCQARIAGEQCVSDAGVRMEALCEHEHRSEVPLCEHHARLATRPMYCQRCHEAGHRCLMRRAPLAVL